MKRAKKILAGILACLIISFPVINVNAAEVTTLADVPFSIMVSCPQHSISRKYLTSYISGTTTHHYQPPGTVGVTCTITTTTHVFAEYCTRCGTVLGNIYEFEHSHSAH